MPLPNYQANSVNLLEGNNMNKIAITTGDPAGIGPEITAKAIRFLALKPKLAYIIYGKLKPFNDGNEITKVNSPQEVKKSGFYWIEIDNYEVEIGKASPESGKSSYEILKRCAEDLNNKELDAVVTCPISKHAIHHTHPDFIGHTEFFADQSATDEVIMSFWGPYFNLALLTTHLAVSEVSSYLTEERLETKFRKIYSEACKLLGAPKVAMLAMNPHAGENGAFGKEDQVIRTMLDRLAKEDVLIDGPFPADTFFSRRATDYDLIISAYHDQGLVPFKMLTADQGVNVTLGLPYIRTSVDHGTAFDIVGKGIANESSLESAIKFADNLLNPEAGTEFKNYSAFAKHYDKYMQEVMYSRWAKLVLDRYKGHYNHDPESILELACGTGNVATLLTKKGYNVDASDLAPEMLKLAAEKEFSPRLFLADMTDEITTGNYDLMILLFDSLNYLNNISQVKKLLTNSHKALNKDGMLIFDIVTLKNSIDNFDGFVNLEDSQSQYIIHQSDLDQDENIQTTELTFFSKSGFTYQRADEIHKQKLFSLPLIKKEIAASKYNLIGIYSTESSENLISRGDEQLENHFARLFFVLEN